MSPSTDPALPQLPNFAKRSSVRVVVPSTIPTYCTIQRRGRTSGGQRGLVRDLSAAGLSMHIFDNLGEPFPEGEAISGRVDSAGATAVFSGEVIRASRNEVGIRFTHAADELFNMQLLMLIMRIVTGKIQYADRGTARGALRHELTHKHFYGPGYLDVRVQRSSPAWWQVVFLEYLCAWSEATGVSTGTIDRSIQNQRTLQMSVNVTRDASPQLPLQILALKLIQR